MFLVFMECALSIHLSVTGFIKIPQNMSQAIHREKKAPSDRFGSQDPGARMFLVWSEKEFKDRH
jgi:hypothetical protein